MTDRNAILFELFEKDLREALAHLYDPLFDPGGSLWVILGIDPCDGIVALQEVVVSGLERLKPDPSVPRHTPWARFYELLSYRYLQGLTQEAAADHLGIAPRYLREQQQKAIHWLAKALWEQGPDDAAQAGDLSRDPVRGEDVGRSGTRSQNWASQLREELALLRSRAPDMTAPVDMVLARAADLGRALAAHHRITLEIGQVEPDAVAIIHPSALRQILLATMAELVQRMPAAGTITLDYKRYGKSILIAVSGDMVTEIDTFDVPLVREILDAYRGSLKVTKDGKSLSLLIELPAAFSAEDKATVLVMEDNEDLVCFYTAYTAGTRYEIVHVSDARRLFSAIEECQPDLIVLDVMFPDPDIDGWELLVHLHDHPATRAVPVIVCSVTQEEQLALSLGATLCLSKPVRRGQFIQALDQALNQAPATSPQAASNTSTTY